MKYFAHLFLSILTMSCLKAGPHRFKDKLPLFKVTGLSEKEFYLFGVFPNAEGKLDMNLLRESGILGLLEECDHLITEFQNVELEDLYNPYIGHLLKLEEEFNDNDEYKKRMKKVVSVFINFELEKYIRSNFSHSISHLYSYSKEKYLDKIYAKLHSQHSLVRDLLTNYRMLHSREQVFERGADVPKFIKLQYLFKLAEERESALKEAYLNMDAEQIINYYMLCDDLPISISLNNHNELLKLHVSTAWEWINKIESYLNKTNQKTFIALDLMHLVLPERYGINFILELQKRGFETKQLSVSDLHV